MGGFHKGRMGGMGGDWTDPSPEDKTSTLHKRNTPLAALDRFPRAPGVRPWVQSYLWQCSPSSRSPSSMVWLVPPAEAGPMGWALVAGKNGDACNGFCRDPTEMSRGCHCDPVNMSIGSRSNPTDMHGGCFWAAVECAKQLASPSHHTVGDAAHSPVDT